MGERGQTLGPTLVSEAVATGSTVRSGVDSSRALVQIRTANRVNRVWNLVLDDDPTGTQTVQDVPVLTSACSDLDLIWAAHQPGNTTFVLTNSRSMEERTAYELTYRLVCQAARVAGDLGLRLRVVSRSDSTLRGHFAAEIGGVHRALRELGHRSEGTVFVPAFIEAGRVTVEDVQWVRGADQYQPAARTEFAQDATFGYDEVDLRKWVDHRLGRRGSSSISLSELRALDAPQQVARRLAGLGPEDVLIVNAAAAADLETLMLGLLLHEDSGHRPVIRCAPSFVRLIAGQEPAAPVRTLTRTTGTGLVVVGSHTALTTVQLEQARRNHRLQTVELDVSQVVGDSSTTQREVQRCTEQLLNALQESDTVLYTSRALVTEGQGTPLLTSKAVADALVDVVRRVGDQHELRYLVAKGGITSSDMFVRALGVRRARVLGQMLPGLIPVWALIDGSGPGLTYVVFPGNVGGADALDHTLRRLRGQHG